MAKTFRNFIAGEWVAPANGDYFENRNPADTADLIGRFPDSDAARRGRGGARRPSAASRSGAARPAPARGDVLRRVGDLLVERKEEIADAMTREMGKALAETRGDVQEGIDTAYYAATEGRRLFGHTVPSELRTKWAMSFRRPIGVVRPHHAVQLPAGDPDVEDVSRAALRERGASSSRPRTCRTRCTCWWRSCSRPGCRPRSSSSCTGAARRSARRWSSIPDVPVISFTGSTETGRIVGETCGRMHKRLSLEMGGKNAMIVMDDADLDLALEGVLWGAFGTTGQRCTATSRLILHTEDPRPVPAPAGRRGARAAAGRRPRRQDRRRPAHPRSLARQGRALRRDRPAEGAELVTGGTAPGGQARRAAGSSSRRSSRA